MKIGFIKLGLKTYFNKPAPHGQGSNHELVDVFNIFKERGHECFMISNSDIGPAWGPKTDLDYIFVFNGPLCPGYESKMNMFAGTIMALTFLKTHKIPWVYFWTDPRKDYDIRSHQIFKDNPPQIILSQEKEFYGHLDKLIMYHQKPLNAPKEIFLTALMNHTDPKRSKYLVNLMNHVSLWYAASDGMEIRGNWKKETNKFLKDPIPENEVIDYLSKVKYAINIGKNPKWVSQKYWEMILAKTICFFINYDEDNLVMAHTDLGRVKDEQDLVNKIQMVEDNPYVQKRIYEIMDQIILPSYLNGDFMYDIINNKINVHNP